MRLEEKWKIYKYELSVKIELNGELKELTEMQIHKLYIEKAYDEDMMPVILLDLMIPLDTYHDILTNKKTVKFLVKLSKYLDTNGNKGSSSPVFNDKFIPIIQDNMPFVDKAHYDTVKYGSGFSKNDVITTDMQYKYSFILVQENTFKAMKTTTNAVLTNSNILDALTFCLNKSGVNKMLMTKLDNSASYSELLLLPIPLFNQLNYLDKYFGLYKAGSQIFFDVDCGYILSNTAECTAWRQNEPKQIVFTVNSPMSGDDQSRGSVFDDKAKILYCNISKDNLSVNSSSVGVDNIIGNNDLVLNTATGNMDKIDSGSEQIGNAIYGVRTTSSCNKFLSSELALRKKENSCVVLISCQDIDVSYITPNKEYKIITDVSNIINRLQGKFRITSHTQEYIKHGGHFTINATFTLKRTSTS